MKSYQFIKIPKFSYEQFLYFLAYLIFIRSLISYISPPLNLLRSNGHPIVHNQKILLLPYPKKLTPYLFKLF